MSRSLTLLDWDPAVSRTASWQDAMSTAIYALVCSLNYSHMYACSSSDASFIEQHATLCFCRLLAVLYSRPSFLQIAEYKGFHQRSQVRRQALEQNDDVVGQLCQELSEHKFGKE